MSLNIGYLTAESSNKTDETYTPPEAVKPIIKYIKPGSKIWCPFDEEDSEYVQQLRKANYDVIFSHIKNGENFIVYEPSEHYDCIVSNPPFSIKDKILKRAFELNKPYALLMPLPALQGQKRFPYLQDCQALIFDKRVNYFRDKKTKEIMKGISFASIYICRNFLPKDLIFEKLGD